MLYIALRATPTFDIHLLEIDWECDVADGSIGGCDSYCEVDHVFYVLGAHDPLVVSSDVHKQPIERDILLRACSDQIVKLEACQCQHRLSVHLGVVKAV